MKPYFRIFPLVLIVVGSVLLLSKQGVIDPAFLRNWWPLLLIAVGVAGLLRPPRACRQVARPDQAG